MNKKVKNLVVGSVLGALTGGIGGYLYGAKQERKELAVEPVEVLQAEVTEELAAAGEAAAESLDQA